MQREHDADDCDVGETRPEEEEGELRVEFSASSARMMAHSARASSRAVRRRRARQLEREDHEAEREHEDRDHRRREHVEQPEPAQLRAL